MARLALIFSIALLMTSCTTVEQIQANKEVYCSGLYKGMRAVGRTALSATAGVVLPDVCDTIDDIVEEEDAEDGVTKSAE
jgi:hypothetical protein